MTSSLFVNIRAQKNGKPYRPAGLIFAVEGTVYPGAPNPPSYILDDGTGYWCGFASGIVGGLCNAQDGLWDSETVGYPARTVPMWPSVQIGRHNLIVAIKKKTDKYLADNGSYDGLVIVLTGWSQGAMVVDQAWTEDILPEGGVLHYLLPFVWRIYNFGDPLRCPGISKGDEMAGLPGPGKQNGEVTGGIGGPKDLTPEQTNVLAPDGTPVLRSFNNHGDLYGAAPVGATPQKGMPAVGDVEYGFFKIIMQPGLVDVVEIAGEIIIHPIGDAEAAWNAGKFFSEAQNAPHYLYYDAMLWCINDALVLGNSLPHESGY